MATVPCYMASTQIDSAKTCGQIQRLLGESGARHVSLEYEAAEVVAVRFSMDIAGVERWFKLPINWQAVYDQLRGSRYETEDQARRTAWRQVLRWVEAQLAMVETDQITTAQAFLPHMIDGQDRTLYELVAGDKIPLLTAGEAGG
jgi:hypothetical protein